MELDWFIIKVWFLFGFISVVILWIDVGRRYNRITIRDLITGIPFVMALGPIIGVLIVLGLIKELEFWDYTVYKRKDDD